MPLPKFVVTEKRCAHCGQTWSDDFPDDPSAIIWCGDCERTPLTRRATAAWQDAFHWADSRMDTADAIKFAAFVQDRPQLVDDLPGAYVLHFLKETHRVLD